MYSRLPGHPVQEIVLAFMPYAGSFAFNLLSALMAGLAVVFFAMIMKHYGFKHYLLGAATLAFIPVFFLSSIYTIDYCWALAFILASFYALLRKRFLLAGIMLGISVGCRLTSALMIIPLVIMAWEELRTRGMRPLFWLIAGFLLSAVLTYMPALIEYGTTIFGTYKLPYPPMMKVLYKGSIGVFGALGSFALIYALVLSLKNIARPPSSVLPLVTPLHRWAWLSAVLLTLLIYIRLPEKSAFLLPALPFLILLASYFMKSSRGYIVFCLLMMLSSFIFSVNITDPYRGASYSLLAVKSTIGRQEIFFDPLNGPVFTDHSKRKNKEAYTTSVAEKLKSADDSTYVIAGWWYNELATRMQDAGKNDHVQLLECADEPQLKTLWQQGYKIFYLEEIDEVNDDRYGKTFTASYARAL
jgi:hypothetical protein